MGKKIIVDQDPEKPIEKHVLARELVLLSGAAQALLKSGVKHHDLVVLLQHRSGGLSQQTIRAVLNAIDELSKTYSK